MKVLSSYTREGHRQNSGWINFFDFKYSGDPALHCERLACARTSQHSDTWLDRSCNAVGGRADYKIVIPRHSKGPTPSGPRLLWLRGVHNVGTSGRWPPGNKLTFSMTKYRDWKSCHSDQSVYVRPEDMGDGTYLRRARRPGNGPSLRWRAGLSLIRQSPKTPQVADRQETSLSLPPPGLVRPAVSSRNGANTIRGASAGAATHATRTLRLRQSLRRRSRIEGRHLRSRFAPSASY